MKAFTTLLWLEWNKNLGLVGVLAGVLLLGVWAIWRLGENANPSNFDASAEVLGFRLLVLIITLTVGGVLALLFSSRILREDQMLLITPPAGFAHSLARFVFVGALGALFTLLAVIATYALARPDALDPRLGLPVWLWGWFYLTVGLWLPAVAGFILLRTLGMAYLLSRVGWLAVIVGFLGIGVVGTWTGILAARAAYAYLPPIPLNALAPLPGLPTEPLPVLLLLSALLLWLAGRIWDEVEA